jgi:hypothetical protein
MNAHATPAGTCRTAVPHRTGRTGGCRDTHWPSRLERHRDALGTDELLLLPIQGKGRPGKARSIARGPGFAIVRQLRRTLAHQPAAQVCPVDVQSPAGRGASASLVRSERWKHRGTERLLYGSALPEDGSVTPSGLPPKCPFVASVWCARTARAGALSVSPDGALQGRSSRRFHVSDDQVDDGRQADTRRSHKP